MDEGFGFGARDESTLVCDEFAVSEMSMAKDVLKRLVIGRAFYGIPEGVESSFIERVLEFEVEVEALAVEVVSEDEFCGEFWRIDFFLFKEVCGFVKDFEDSGHNWLKLDFS